MDSGIENSINGILERARYQIDNLLEQIDYFLKKRFSAALKDSQRNIEAFKKIAENIGIDIELDNSVYEKISSYVENLNILQSKLSQMNITEHEILNDFSMEQTQEMLNLIEPALEEASTNLINLATSAISEGLKQKMEKERQIQELREKRAYLQGKLDNKKWKGKKYKAIEEEIASIDEQIVNLEKTSDNNNTFKEWVGDTNNSGEENVQKLSNQRTESEIAEPSHEEK